jgi:hypothetical protein
MEIPCQHNLQIRRLCFSIGKLIIIPVSIGFYGVVLGHAAACPYEYRLFYFKLVSESPDVSEFSWEKQYTV